MTTKFFYDFEFAEDGTSIEPLSMGMVCGYDTLYLVRQFEFGRRDTLLCDDDVWDMASGIPFVAENILPEIQRANNDGEATQLYTWGDRILSFMRKHTGPYATREDVELWGYYPAYDHVALAQLFGRMVDLPEPIPMFTRCLQQEICRTGLPERYLPKNDRAHNALEDSLWNRNVLRTLLDFERGDIG